MVSGKVLDVYTRRACKFPGRALYKMKIVHIPRNNNRPPIPGEGTRKLFYSRCSTTIGAIDGKIGTLERPQLFSN